jgi:hypothetical protein
MNENPALENWKRGRGLRERRVRNEDYDDYDDAESERIEAEDINIDEYLSNEQTIIKHKLVITVTMMMIAKHHLLFVSFLPRFNQ